MLGDILFKKGNVYEYNKELNSIKIECLKSILAAVLVFSVFYLYIKFTNIKQHYAMAYSLFLGLYFYLPACINLGRAKKIIEIVLYMCMPLMSFYIVEFLNGNKIFEDLTYTQIYLNIIWYCMIYIAVLIVLKRMTLSVIISGGIFLFIGIANHYVFKFRGTVIFPCDIISWRTALNVADNFDFSFDNNIIMAISLFVLQCLFAAKILGNRCISIKKIFYALCVIVFGTYIIVFFFTPMLPNIGIYAQQWKTQANGFVLNFTTALRYSNVEKPNGYDAKNIVIDYNYDDGLFKAKPTDIRPKNIIVIMNESFNDFSEFERIILSEDPAPYFHSLSENTIKGKMYSPVTGGGTANVEYEYLTGNSLSFLPEGTVAYQLYVSDDTPNMARQMKKFGYETTAFHPYIASGWNRPEVYSNFGFDTQIFVDDLDMSKVETIRKYVSDISDYKKIFDITDNAVRPQFIFNVTMQNHSGYDKIWHNQKYNIYPLNASIKNSDVAEQYFSLVKESDDAIKHIIEHYKNVKEPTLIVFFGDHQPPLGQNFYNYAYGKPISQLTVNEALDQYSTSFFIWANYDIPEAEDVKISSNYLGVITANIANIPLTDYQKFLNTMMNEMPIFTNVAIVDKYNVVTERDDFDALTDKQKKFVEDYNYLNYYNLFDMGKGNIDALFY